MLIYEVNLRVTEAVAEPFGAWLHGHVQDMLALPGFLRADVFVVEDDLAPSGPHWTVHYRLASQQALDRYLLQEAAQMRAEGSRRFGASISASRRLLRPQPAPGNAPVAGLLRIKDIDHVVLRVRNVDEMVRFYADILGCVLEKAQAGLGLYQLRAGSSLIDLVTVDGPIGRKGGAAPRRTGHNMDHFCLRVEPFDGDAIVAWLADQGVTVGEVGWRYGADGDGPSIYLSDPEGNTVELKGPAQVS